MTDEIQFHELTGLWWPKNTSPEAGFEYMIRRVTDIDLAVKFCRKTAVAVQAGGNVGMWPIRLSKFFSHVVTFEPVPVIYHALTRNIMGIPGIVPYNKLLGAHEGDEVMFSVRSGGVSRVHPEGDVLLKTTTIDALNLPACDALFLDVEGFELECLEGAVKTIEAYHPVITLECWDDKRADYDAHMALLGYTREVKTHGDMIYIHRRNTK